MIGDSGECILVKSIGAHHIRHGSVSVPDLRHNRHVHLAADELQHELVERFQGAIASVVHEVTILTLPVLVGSYIERPLYIKEKTGK